MTLQNILAGAAVGILTGVFYFGLLWLTVKRLPDSPRPTILVLSSFLGRSALAVGALYIVLTITDIIGLLAAVGTFVITKMTIVGIVKSQRGMESTPEV